MLASFKKRPSVDKGLWMDASDRVHFSLLFYKKNARKKALHLEWGLFSIVCFKNCMKKFVACMKQSPENCVFYRERVLTRLASMFAGRQGKGTLDFTDLSGNLEFELRLD